MKPTADFATGSNRGNDAARAFVESVVAMTHREDIGPWLGQVTTTLDAPRLQPPDVARWHEAVSIALTGMSDEPASASMSRRRPPKTRRGQPSSPPAVEVLQRARSHHARMSRQPLR